MKRTGFISVVVPAYNERESLVELSDRIEAALHGLGMEGAFEILFVDDGSTDGSTEVLEALAASRPHVRAVILRANAGKSLALMAGFRAARGETLLTLDADLQDCPEDIPKLLEKTAEGFDLVVGRRKRRNDGWVRRLGSKLFNGVVKHATGLALQDMNCGFKALRGPLAQRLLLVGHLHRYMAVLAHLEGFRVTEVPVENEKRRHGSSKYPAFRFHALFDLLSILFLQKYRFTPHHFFGSIGALTALPGLALLAAAAVRAALFDPPRLSVPLVLLGAGLLLLGVQVFLLGWGCDYFMHQTVRGNLEEWLWSRTREILPREDAAERGRRVGPLKDRRSRKETVPHP